MVSSGEKKQRLREDMTNVYIFSRGGDTKGGTRRGKEILEEK